MLSKSGPSATQDTRPDWVRQLEEEFFRELGYTYARPGDDDYRRSVARQFAHVAQKAAEQASGQSASHAVADGERRFTGPDGVAFGDLSPREALARPWRGEES